jgi:predicted HTH transcriptional regulator
MSDKINIQDLIDRGESQAVEFKRSMSLVREALESICGMINNESAQGTVIFGVEPDGNIVGVEPGNLDKAQQTLSKRIVSKFDPPIITNIISIQHLGKNLIIMRASRSPNVAYHEYDGRAFIREGTTTRKLGLSEKQALLRCRNRDQHNGPWKCNKCGSLVGQLAGFEFSNNGVKKTYRCDCGGEFWPIE